MDLAPGYAEVAARNHAAMVEAVGRARLDEMAFDELAATLRRYNALTWDAYVDLSRRFEALPHPRGVVVTSTMLAVSRWLARYVVRDGTERRGSGI